MLNFLKKLQCRKCPYYLGYIKFAVSPCINCKANVGKNMLPFLDKLFDNKNKNKN